MTGVARVGGLTSTLLLVLAATAAGQSPEPGQSPGTGEVPGTSARPRPTVLWRDATAETIGTTSEWTNKVEVADINGDGLLDILHANGGNYSSPGTPARQGIFLNHEAGHPFTDASDQILGDGRYLARVIKARDVTGDGIVDLLIGTSYQTQSRLLRGLGRGAFEDVTDALLPRSALSVGDLEVGDVDGDGDMDIVLADWGPGDAMENSGGPVRLWRNDGDRWVQDDAAMPSQPVGFSWDMELVDVDLDWDLDVVVSCKMCPTSRLYLNDGTGSFTDVTTGRMPGFSNNYEFEAMDLDGDADPELVTINDGPGAAEHVFRNDAGTFTDVTAEWWPKTENPGFDDNMVAFLDADSDGDADFLIGSLDGPDRLIRNDGSGHLSMDGQVISGPPTPGTLAIALGDLDGDERIDIVEGEGESADVDHVFLGTALLPVDGAPPAIDAVDVRILESGVTEVRARVHDRKSPVTVDDFRSVTVRDDEARGAVEYPMTWYGDSLWRAQLPLGSYAIEDGDAVVCAVDRAGNRACRS